MLKKEEKQILGMIDGVETEVQYACTPFAAMHAIRLSVKLAKAFGGGISQAAKGGLSNMGDMDVSKVLDAILSNLDEVETPKLIVELLAKTERNGIFLTQSAIDKVFTQNFGELMRALRFALEVNFGGFFSALATASENIGSAQLQSEEKA